MKHRCYRIAKPLTVRFDIVNLFDKIYEIRDGSGIGVFAPQFGARRGYLWVYRRKSDELRLPQDRLYVAVTWPRRYRQARPGS